MKELNAAFPDLGLKTPEAARELLDTLEARTLGEVMRIRKKVEDIVDPFFKARRDAVASIEPLGEQETYDLTVPGDHNFVANDIVVHNSALMANFCENAALEGKKAVALFSLEMSESELAQRFIASQGSIKGNDLRRGKVPRVAQRDGGGEVGVGLRVDVRARSRARRVVGRPVRRPEADVDERLQAGRTDRADRGRP